MKNSVSFIYNYLKPFLAIIFCFLGIVALQLPKITEKPSLITKSEAIKEEQQKKLRLDFLKRMPSFGYDNMMANWVFLDFIQYYGDGAARDLTGNSLCEDYFEIVVAEDPRFINAYFYLSPATSLFGGNPEKSVALISQGLQYISPEMPLAYQLWLYKGIDEILFIGNNQAAIHSYSMAAEWAKFDNSETAEVAARSAQETVKFLESNPDSKLVRASAWMMVFSNARDEQTRKLALIRMKELGAKIVITPNSISVSMPKEEEGNQQSVQD
jgi:hypothetical protein